MKSAKIRNLYNQSAFLAQKDTLKDNRTNVTTLIQIELPEFINLG